LHLAPAGALEWVGSDGQMRDEVRTPNDQSGSP